jgi:protein-S-isoprenylcysteine O-methyltransferase Ste14
MYKLGTGFVLLGRKRRPASRIACVAYAEWMALPVPKVTTMKTQRLIVEPPFPYTRNPMALGTIQMYLGVAVLRRSLVDIGSVFAAVPALLASSSASTWSKC